MSDLRTSGRGDLRRELQWGANLNANRPRLSSCLHAACASSWRCESGDNELSPICVRLQYSVVKVGVPLRSPMLPPLPFFRLIPVFPRHGRGRRRSILQVKRP